MVYYDPANGEIFVGQLAYKKELECPSNCLKGEHMSKLLDKNWYREPNDFDKGCYIFYCVL